MNKKLLTVTLGLTAVALACAHRPCQELEANKDLVRRFTAALNAGDFDALDGIVTEDFSRHSQATPDVEVRSREDFKKLQETYAAISPDQHIEIKMLIAEGDKVAALATYTGTQTGPMGSFPATGKKYTMTFLSIFRIQDGRIAELWVEWDNMAILKQLGLLPPPPAPAG
jgi:steroid delta-isomerase-like uncharacterized protein